ncbi:MAG TPA: YbhB/YbcL family Raf kinase inhibitor-like protein [Syntrophobacteraceae bacterium]|nr:YbhB/YbcL family Raf kinase inhibitor-like protein [Syntrophobacteraceae bacterium]
MNGMLAFAFFTAAVLLMAIPMQAEAAMELSSPAFKDEGAIPSLYARPAAGGRNVSLPLKWTGAPEGTRSFALSIVDQHPVARKWVHWMVLNIPAEVSSLNEGASGRNMPAGAIEIGNSFGTVGYGGPQPPKGTGVHRYVVTIYALKDARLNLKIDATLADFQDAIKAKTLGQASITGLFEQ